MLLSQASIVQYCRVFHCGSSFLLVERSRHMGQMKHWRTWIQDNLINHNTVLPTNMPDLHALYENYFQDLQHTQKDVIFKNSTRTTRNIYRVQDLQHRLKDMIFKNLTRTTRSIYMLLNAGELISNKQVIYIWKKTEPIINNTYGRHHYPYCLHWLVNSMLSHWWC